MRNAGETDGWKSVLLGLLALKALYLAGVVVAVQLRPSFNEQRAAAVDVRWFDGRGRTEPETRSAVGRHFATWDAQHYLFLSREGYDEGVRSSAFYPLWPLLIRLFSVFTGGSHLIAGMILANAFSLVGWCLFYEVARRRFGGRVALWGLVFLIAYPGSLFQQFIYSEPLFFLLAMLVWRGLEHRRYGLAWIAAFLLPVTRAVGVFSVLPIAWHWLMRRDWQWLRRRGWLKADRERVGPATPVGNIGWRESTLVAAPALGLGLYFLLMWGWTGNPFEGMAAQQYWGVHSISNLWNVPKFVTALAMPTTPHDLRGSMLDRTMFLMLLYTLPLIWRLGKDMVVWTYILGILPAMSGNFTSFTRFACCAFPVFLALAVLSERPGWRWLKWAVVGVFGILHMVLLWRFVNFRWAG